MRKGFNQFCPDCQYSAYLNSVYGKCYCLKLRTVVSRKRFPPLTISPSIPDTCEYFKPKH